MPRRTTTAVTPVAPGTGLVLDAAGEMPLEPQRRAAHVPLGSLDDCRAEMSRVYRKMASGVLDKQEGSRLIWTLSQIARVIEASVIEQRLAQLEALAARATPHG